MNRRQFINLMISLLLITVMAFTSGCDTKSAADTTHPSTEPTTTVESLPYVKNVILLIGDGMGLAHIDAARLYYAGREGLLNMQQMPVTGFITSYSANNLITDSAAAGTALSTGFKTNNDIVAMSPDGKTYTTIAEACQKEGLSIGIVTTTSILDATPAAFSSHAMARGSSIEIAQGFLKNKFNVVLGGGANAYKPLITKANELGYKVALTEEEMDEADCEYLMGLFNASNMTGTGVNEPTIAEMTKKAIEILGKDEDGFFLMVEGGLIDKGSHAQDPIYTLPQTLAFDEAVKTAVDFAALDENTLVIVTADHETGDAYIGKGNMDGKEFGYFFGIKDHSGVSLPVFAYGPESEAFMGFYDNTDIPKKIAALLGIEKFPFILESEPVAEGTTSETAAETSVAN
ncbi:MAG: alkaline phosphatase [Eubacteriales bacterium]|nr:alkaline phosphatase [Eubacteriales bacterium]